MTKSFRFFHFNILIFENTSLDLVCRNIVGIIFSYQFLKNNDMRFIFTYLFCMLCICTLSNAQNSLGFIQSNTNKALPSSYNFKEYVFAEPDDQGICDGSINTTANIEEVFLSQTHRHAIGHPLFFTIGHRPALLQVAITGEGSAPDVQVEGFLEGNSLGTLCLAGPSTLNASIELNQPNFEDYFSITLPRSWIQDGLELILNTGNESKTITSTELKIGPYTEMNLVMVNMDVLDYNGTPHRWPKFEDFLQELASAIPASTVRFGIFPKTLTFPEIVGSNGTAELVRLTGQRDKEPNGITSDGSINSIATLFLSNLHQSTGDYLSTVYFGNTLNLAPGGWGGGKSFVGFDYTDIFIHELGHALSLPHWGEGSYNNPDPNPNQFNYPYGGEDDNGGGRGTAWNFIQDKYEFVNPICENNDGGNLGKERSDCMQRSNRCIGNRSYGLSPWDGYGDFSALAIHRYLVGAAVTTGQVEDRMLFKDFQLRQQQGFPIINLEDGKRVYTRDPLQPQELRFEELNRFPGSEQIEQEVYLIYGTAHETQAQANIVYKPLKFKGTLPAVIDPTDPATFDALKDPQFSPYFYATRDITLRLTYADGTVRHVLNPNQSFARDYDFENDWLGIWRYDVSNYSLVVPGDKELLKVEVFHRPFCVRSPFDNTLGNINFSGHNITPENFMEDAVFQTQYEFGQPQVVGSNTIGNRVWHDINQNGINETDEPGIANVSLVLWEDGDGDDIPDWMGFRGVVKTDSAGYYSFTGLEPGNYLVFVWSLDNWEEGQPLNGMVPTDIFSADPNSDINLDNNGRPGIEFGLTNFDIASGIITLTAEGEPLNDGDREDCWFDYDVSGNMTIDFGFYIDGATHTSTLELDNGIIYPNPFEDDIIIETTNFANHTFTLLSANGKEMIQVNLNSISTKLTLDRLPSGIYIGLIRNPTGNIQWSEKIIKL